MLKFTDYDIVFQEIPNEITLAINISGCPNRCKNCHTPILMTDVGETLDESVLSKWMEKYGVLITCVCFMGGDANKNEVEKLARFIREKHSLRIGWYSGQEEFPKDTASFDYVKLGKYIQSKGGLQNISTNQRLYFQKSPNQWTDITYKLQNSPSE